MKFSVIIPVYNVAPYLRECLDSVRAQTFADWEAVCVDDGSTDASGAILDEYVAKDPRFRVIHQPNAGEGAARNAGLDVAQGEWIVYVDSDDLIRPTLLADLRRVMAADPSVEMVNAPHVVRFEDGDAVAWSESDDSAVVGRTWQTGATLPPGVACVCVGGVAYKRSVFGDLRFADFKIGADLVYTAACFARASSIGNMMRPSYAYRQRATSISHVRKTPRLVHDAIAFLPAMFRNYAASGKALPASITRLRGNAWIENAVALIVDNADGSEAWDAVWAYWFSTLEEAKAYRFFTPWQRFVVFAVRTSRSRAVARVLCEAPYRLKRLRARLCGRS